MVTGPMGVVMGRVPVGLVGLGLMGAVLTEPLLEHGYSVFVWNRTRQKASSGTGAQAVPLPEMLPAVWATR